MMIPGMLAQSVKGGAVGVTEKLQCPRCHNEVSADSRFCRNCGAQLIIMNRCPECRIELPAEAKFCSNCGHKLGTELACPHCGTKLPPGTKYCTNCGEQVEKGDDAG
jgi:predicted amidophosphoribosyltransferase